MSLVFWLPPVVWMVVIATFSTAPFSGEHTGTILVPLIRFIAPFATGHEIAAIHFLVRKLAHLTEFAILAALWLRAFSGRSTSLAVAIGGTLAICVAWAALDELHQTLVPTRGGSGVDVGIDLAGALIGLALAIAARRFRRGPAPSPGPSVRLSAADRAYRGDRRRKD